MTRVTIHEQEMEILKISDANWNGSNWWFTCHWADNTVTPQSLDDILSYDCMHTINSFIEELLNEDKEIKAKELIELISNLEEEINKKEKDEEIEIGILGLDIPDNFFDGVEEFLD